MADERIIFRTQLNWSLYIKGVLFIIAGMAVSGYNKYIALGLVALGLIMALWTYLIISSSEFVITDRRVLIKTGIININTLETMLNKIEAIHVKQGLIDRMLNSGTITVIGTGGTGSLFNNIDKPFGFRNAVTEQIASVNKG